MPSALLSFSSSSRPWSDDGEGDASSLGALHAPVSAPMIKARPRPRESFFITLPAARAMPARLRLTTCGIFARYATIAQDFPGPRAIHGGSATLGTRLRQLALVDPFRLR